MGVRCVRGICVFAMVLVLSSSGVATAQEAEEPAADAEAVDEAPAEAAAEPAPAPDDWQPPPDHRFWYTNTLVARVNPLGLINDFQMGYRYRLFDSDSILFRDTFIGLAIKPRFSPAWLAPGVAFEFQPIAVFNFRAVYWRFLMFNGFNHLQAFASPNDEYPTDVLDDIKDDDRRYAGASNVVNLQAMLQGKVGPIAIRDTFQFEWQQVEHGNNVEAPVYYTPIHDTLIPREGFTMTNDADVLWLSGFGLVLGLRHSTVHTLFDEDDFLPGEETENLNTPIQRLGILAAYTFWDEPGTMFNKPTLITLVQWHLEHRYRTGEDVSAGIPYLVLGFRFEGDLTGGDNPEVADFGSMIQ